MYADKTVELTWEGVSKVISVTQGTGQGSRLGPKLFSFYMYKVMQLWTEENPSFHKHLLYKDDNITTGRAHSTPGYLARAGQTNFADDTSIAVGSSQSMAILIPNIMTYLSEMGLDSHASTPTKPAPKSAVVHFPADGVAHADPPIYEVDRRSGTFISTVEEHVLLGDPMHFSLNDDHTAKSRLTKATGIFAKLRPKLLASRHASREVKRHVFIGIVLSTLLHGAETWVISAAMKRRLTVFHNRCVRSMTRHNRTFCWSRRISMYSLRKKLNLKPMEHLLDIKTLSWAGHLARMPISRLPRQCLTSYLPYARKIGAPHLTHGRALNGALHRQQIDKNSWMETAQDRAIWKSCTQAQPRPTGRPFKPNRPLLNSRVLKKFGSKWYGGSITGLDEEADTHRPIWRVTFDDGDFGDYYENEITQNLMDPSDPVELALATLDNPDSIIGNTVQKKFGGRLHHGIVANFNYDSTTDDIIWRIIYDDQDCEDLNWQELYPVLDCRKLICVRPAPRGRPVPLPR